MSEQELKDLVESYILEGISSDNADCLHELDELAELPEEAFDETYRQALELWRSAKVEVSWDE